MDADHGGKRPLPFLGLRQIHLQVLVVRIGELDVTGERDALRNDEIRSANGGDEAEQQEK